MELDQSIAPCFVEADVNIYKIVLPLTKIDQHRGSRQGNLIKLSRQAPSLANTGVQALS